MSISALTIRSPLAFSAWCVLAALLVTPVTANAQTTVWSATLTVKGLGFGDKGCLNSHGNTSKQCSNTSTLSEDEFTDDGTDYAITEFYNNPVSGYVVLKLDTPATAATQALTLVIGGTSYALPDGSKNADSTQWTWNSTTQAWTNGDEIAVSLVGFTAPVPATGQPAISGVPQVGKTLTAAVDDIEDDNGVPSTSDFTYQWARVDALANETNIGSNASTYTVAAADVGHTIKVKVSFTDLRGNAEGPFTSDAYPPRGTISTTPTGTCLVDSDWCTTITVADDRGDGLALGYEYHIDDNEFKHGSADDVRFNYGGVTFVVDNLYYNLSDVIPEVYVGIKPINPIMPHGTVFKFGEHTFTVDDISLDHQAGGNRWPFPSDLFWGDGQEVRASLKLANFPAGGTVAISGTPESGQALTANTSGLSDLDGLTSAVYTYQWIRKDGANETDISGATGSVYSPTTDDVGKQLKVEVRFTDDAGNAEVVVSGAYPANGTIGQGTNTAPVFGEGGSTSRSLDETFADQTVQQAADIGGRVYAADGDNDPLTYSLQGEDADRFTILSSTGQLRTKAGETYDYEEQSSYSVTVQVDDGQGGRDVIAVTVNLDDRAESPPQPDPPTVSATPGSFTSLDVSWTAPDSPGRPPITHYNLRYRENSVETWTNGPRNVTGTAAQITGLTPNTLYRVQVQAVNDEGSSAWSASNSDSDSDSDSDSNSNSGRTSAPAVRFGASAYTAIEGVQSATVTVELNPADNKAVTVPLTVTHQNGASSADYSGVPASVTFAAGETSKTFTLTATHDSSDDEGESVLLGFGTLPTSIKAGSPATATVTLLQDSGISTWYVSFGQSSYTATEGGAGARVTVSLSSPWKPERNEALTVPLFTPTPQGGATTADFSGVPESVTFQPGQTQVSFTVRATNDSDDDDGESVLLRFGTGLPADLEVGRGPYSATVHLADNDGTRTVTVSFGAATYTATEDGTSATVSVQLNNAPGRSVTIPLTTNNRGANSDDYSGVPGSVTFGANETERTFTVTATDDNVDDDLESVTLGFRTLPEKVSAGSPSTATVNLTDNDGDWDFLTVRFDASASAGATREVREGGGAFLGIHLDKEPNHAVTIPLVVENLGGATADDYTGVPSSVTFGRGKKDLGISIRGVDDAEDDDGEGFRVSFGTLPKGVSVSSWSGPSTTFTIIDNDSYPGVRISDDSKREWPNPISYLRFVVTLTETAQHEVRVDYETRDGTAKAGEDYVATSGTLVFDEGDREGYVWVEIIDDDHDEDTETMTVVLSNPVRTELLDATGNGRIRNTDPMPRAFLARFGRGTAVEVVAQVEERIRAPRTPGMSARLAGRKLRPGMERDVAMGLLNQLGDLARSNAPAAEGKDRMAGTSFQPTGRAGTAGDPDWSRVLRTGVGVGDLLTGSSFELNRPNNQGGVLSLWSRGARAQFAGRDGRVSLDGKTATTLAGADYRQGRLAAGLSLAHSRGRGAYQGVDVGDLASSVTGLYPWVGYRVTERVTLWGVTGYGRGTLNLTPGKGAMLQNGLSMAMAAAGLRGQLTGSAMAGFGLAVKADALWVDTGIEGVEGPAGRLAAAAAATTRLRTALEASRGYALGHGLALEPSVEVGLRQDGGDAETGAGADVAGGLILSSPSRGIRADLRVRTLLMHQDQQYRDRGVLVSFSYDPSPSTPLGFTARVVPSWGGPTRSGAEALWSRNTMSASGGLRPETGAQLNTELEFGLSVGSRLVGTPLIGILTTATSRQYELGYRLASLRRGVMNFELGVVAQHREYHIGGTARRGATGRVKATW